ncbi:MAG: ABC transporter substrate-binding protein [Peptococcia bacterium]
MLQRKSLTRILAALLCLVLMISMIGCSKEGDPGTNDVVEETAQGVTDTTIRIGSMGALSGALAFISVPFVHGMEAYFKKVNDEGGIHGRKIELVVKDDEFDPAKSLQAMESLIYDEKVFAIVGQGGTPNVMATMDIVKEVGIPSVYFGSGAAALTTAGPNFFPVQPTYDYEGKLLTKFAIDHFKAEKIVVLYQNDDVGRDGLSGITQALEILNKKDAVAEEGKIAFGASDTDFAVQVQKAKNLDPDAIILYGLSGAAGGILKEMEKIGLNVPTLTTYSNADPSFANLIGPAAPNAILNLYATGWSAIDDLEKMEPYYEMQEKYFPGEQINAFTTAGWVAAETFVAGLRNAGENPTWESYIKGMESVKFTGGLTPKIIYGPGVRQGVSEMNLYQFKKDEASGTFVIEEVVGYTSFK